MAETDLRAAAKAVWWLVLLRGVLAVLFGLFALFAPGTALLALVFVFASYAILDGVVAIVAGVRHRRDEKHWVWQVVQGVVSVLAGLVAFLLPGVTVYAVLLLVAFWSVAGGVVAIVESVVMRRRDPSWGWALAAGVVSVLFGIVLFTQPGAALVTLLVLLGVYAIVFGVVLVVWAFRLRGAVRGAVGS